ncbi:MAG: PIN domain-containing protein [Bacteroidetes bacterium]|nr:PIN domain-containing protein [Bacteroidota bacterium]
MNDRFFIDSNVCLYLFDKDEPEKSSKAKELLKEVPIVSTQVLAETANVLIKDFDFSKEETRQSVCFIRNNSEVIQITSQLFDTVFKIFIRYKFSFYDSMIVAAALEAGCSILYSGDLQHKQVIENPEKNGIGKLTIINPFLSR